MVSAQDIYEELISFMENMETMSDSDVKGKFYLIDQDLGKLDESPEKDQLLDGFAVCITNYVVFKANSFTSTEDVAKYRDTLISYLNVAKGYAKNDETISRTNEIFDSLNGQAQNSAEVKGIIRDINSFNASLDSTSANDVGRYVDDMKSRIDNLESKSINPSVIDSVSDGFAISLNNYIVTRINNLGKHVKSHESELVGWLVTASEYVRNSDSKKQISESQKFFFYLHNDLPSNFFDLTTDVQYKIFGNLDTNDPINKSLLDIIPGRMYLEGLKQTSDEDKFKFKKSYLLLIMQ